MFEIDELHVKRGSSRYDEGVAALAELTSSAATPSMGDEEHFQSVS